MGKSSYDREKLLRVTIAVLLAVFLIATTLLLLKLWERKHGTFPEQEAKSEYIEHEGKKYVLRDDIETFLILGLDKFEGDSEHDSYNNDMQADFLMLLVFDHNAEKCTALHINRDTMVSMNKLGLNGNSIGKVTRQIALAHTYGNGKDRSCTNTADAVSELLLGVKVNHYLSLTMDGVPIYNDLLGGVEVEVLDDFTGIDDTLKKGEKVTLSGEQALTYVRTRQGLEDSSNTTRMKRQRQYISELQKKTRETLKSNDAFAVEATLKLSDYLISDRSATQLQDMMKKFSDYDFAEISTLKGENKVGEKYMEFYPNEDEIRKLVVELFCKESD